MKCLCLLAGSIITLAVVSSGAARATDVSGVADLPYDTGVFSSTPDAAIRQKAIDAAESDAWNHYVATFNPSRGKIYKAVERQFIDNLGAYLTGVIVVDEVVNKANKRYSVAVRATVNEPAVEATLKAGTAAGAQSSGQGSLFTFVFLARDAGSVKSFDAKTTGIVATEDARTATKEKSLQGDKGTVNQSSQGMVKVVQGGSTERKADEISYRVHSAGDVDAAMSDVMGVAGFDVVGYADIYSNCGGPSPDVLKAEFSSNDELSPGVRKQMIDAARACGVVYLAVGTLDVGLNDTDPVSGNQRVYVSVRGQVWDITSKLPRKLASVGPVQYAGLGPDPVVAGRNALQLSAKESAKIVADQLNARGAH